MYLERCGNHMNSAEIGQRQRWGGPAEETPRQAEAAESWQRLETFHSDADYLHLRNLCSSLRHSS